MPLPCWIILWYIKHIKTFPSGMNISKLTTKSFCFCLLHVSCCFSSVNATIADVTGQEKCVEIWNCFQLCCNAMVLRWFCFRTQILYWNRVATLKLWHKSKLKHPKCNSQTKYSYELVYFNTFLFVLHLYNLNVSVIQIINTFNCYNCYNIQCNSIVCDQ